MASPFHAPYLEVKTVGLESLIASLERFGEEITEFEPLWSDISDIMVASTEELFATEGRGQWPPLAERTIREKTRLGYPLDPLIRRGHDGGLLGSLTDPELAAQVHGDSFSWGTDVRDDRGREFA